MARFDPAQYGPAFAGLLQVDRLRSLGKGTPEAANRLEFEARSLREVFAHVPVGNLDMAQCCLAGVWLLHDFLDLSHTVSQGISTASGSFWHGIMHRREGDFSNAKYWFRKVGDHPVYGQLADAVQELGEERLLAAGEWDPFGFVDTCQLAVEGRGLQAASCQRAQQLEWELLFDHCYSAAVL